MTYLLSFGAVACALAGVLLLWLAWGRRERRRLPLIMSLVAWTGTFTLWIVSFGAEIGIPLTLECTAIVAFLFILTRLERRSARPARDRVAPALPIARGRWWRGSIRVLAAGPLGFAAAMGAGLVFATNAPLVDATRLIVAGLLIPSLWAMAMIWSLASRRAVLPTAGLFGISVATIGLSVALAR